MHMQEKCSDPLANLLGVCAFVVRAVGGDAVRRNMFQVVSNIGRRRCFVILFFFAILSGIVLTVRPDLPGHITNDESSLLGAQPHLAADRRPLNTRKNKKVMQLQNHPPKRPF